MARKKACIAIVVVCFFTVWGIGELGKEKRLSWFYRMLLEGDDTA